ncbi:reverse transcriptase domain-containing protein [Tanacetum coccineum]
MSNMSKDISISLGYSPMLDRIDFKSWQQRIRMDCLGKDNGENIMKSITKGPFQMGMVVETLADGTEGALHLGPERVRVFTDLIVEEKERNEWLEQNGGNVNCQLNPIKCYNCNGRDIARNVHTQAFGIQNTSRQTCFHGILLEEVGDLYDSNIPSEVKSIRNHRKSSKKQTGTEKDKSAQPAEEHQSHRGGERNDGDKGLRSIARRHPTQLIYHYSEKLPVIIAKDLSDDEKTALIKVLKSRKQAIAWKLSDIKGINPEFCSHKILMEDDYEPAVQHQRRVNPKIHDVIKKEVEKLLDAGLIYPISDSPWVSPVHCVPKKGGMTVVTNDENELVPTRLVTGWRVCIDYRKLNEATRKDHFPLPFMDQMLERLAGNEYYCFLDGFSGYFQIPIDPNDQEKTTFTCPYGTFAYRRMPFGLCNAPGTFQRCMMAIFHDMIEKTMEVFMDDFSVFGDSFSTCLTNLEKNA